MRAYNIGKICSFILLVTIVIALVISGCGTTKSTTTSAQSYPDINQPHPPIRTGEERSSKRLWDMPADHLAVSRWMIGPIWSRSCCRATGLLVRCHSSQRAKSFALVSILFTITSEEFRDRTSQPCTLPRDYPNRCESAERPWDSRPQAYLRIR